MAEAEVVDLREALQTQSAALRKLFEELEEERQAAASGAEEALSMIARLQEEKAAAKMEARQYKRIAEEKLRHADESLLILREVMLQKEMEIAALRFLVQDYRQMVGAGSNNMDRMRTKHQQKGSLARNISLPATQLEELSSELHIRDKFSCLLLDEQSSIQESDATKSKTTGCSSQENSKSSMKFHENGIVQTRSAVQHVNFRNWDHVQENQNRSHGGGANKQILQEFHLETQWRTKGNNGSSKLVRNAKDEKKSFGVECQGTSGNSEDGSSTCQTDVEQLKKQMQKLENDMKEMRHGNVDKGRELMQMLGRLAEQLDDIKSHVTKADANSECHREDDHCALTCLQEAMLSFWI
ncbi:uncharacterized protein LOC141821696 [Curcuma longa]|uniref:uncharacterized protein LOC141821696 n=1 Tax=Curcuma longa TaxID=136217 RepID=UPI003D9F028D